jgi:hypothetical protein
MRLNVTDSGMLGMLLEKHAGLERLKTTRGRRRIAVASRAVGWLGGR